MIFNCGRCNTGKFLILLLLFGLTYLVVIHRSPDNAPSEAIVGLGKGESNIVKKCIDKIGRIWRKPPRLPPQLPPNELSNISNDQHPSPLWISMQEKVKEAFIHAWSGYKKYALGYDELKPLSQNGTDGLGGLGATVVDSLDTAMIMGADEIVSEASMWVEKNLVERIDTKEQVNLFETTIRVLGGLLSAYHLSGGMEGSTANTGVSADAKVAKPQVYVEIAKHLADRLLVAFTSSPTSIPFCDVVLHDHSAHPAPDGSSSTSEVTTLQLEFNYLSTITGDPKYHIEAMKVLELFRTLPKVDGLVPIYISPHTGQFKGQNIRLGSRGDSYYEYLIKVWLQQKDNDNQHSYLYEMYTEAMKGVRHLLVQKSTPNGLVFVGELPSGSKGAFSPKMDHLVCFLPGTLALGATKGTTRR